MSRNRDIVRHKKNLKTYYSFSDAEFRTWLAAWRATRTALDDAKIVVEEGLNMGSMENRDMSRQALADIEEKISCHIRLKLAFYANLIALSAPSLANKAVIEKIADDVESLIGSFDDATHAHDLAKDVVQRFNMAIFG